MMKRLYAFIALLIALLMPTYAWADNFKVGDTFTADGITYTVNSIAPMEVVVGYDDKNGDPAIDKSTEGTIAIPSSVAGSDGNMYAVTRIGQYAFVECGEIATVIIPNSIKTIGLGAFLKCTSLTTIDLPNSVTTLEPFVFFGCTSLQSIDIPTSVTCMGQTVFGNCVGLKSVIIPNSVIDFRISMFYQCDGLETATLPNSITSIGESTFQDCYNLISVEIPATVTTIERWAFYGCSSLVAANIPNSVTTIGEMAFRECKSLPSLVIPSSVSSIGRGAFFDCRNLKEIRSYIEEPFVTGDDAFSRPNFSNATLYVPVGTKAKYEATEGWKEFKNIVEMTPYDVLDDNTVAAHFLEPDENGKVEIPETVEIDGKTYTVTEIAADAFRNNEELTEVTIPGSVTTIGDGAFAGCENLRAIYVYAPEPISLTADEARSLMTRAAENIPSQLEGIDFDACTLYVPIGSEQKYREAEGWKLFTHIVGVTDPSGIATVYTEKNDYGAVYNLSGQRLAAPQKGLNIVDGRKVVMK